MMPVHINNDQNLESSGVCTRTLPKNLIMDSNLKGNISDIIDGHLHFKQESDLLSFNPCEAEDSCAACKSFTSEDKTNHTFTNYENFKKHFNSSNHLCLKTSEEFLDCTYKCKQMEKFSKKSVAQLQKYSLKQLQVLVEDLSHAVEQVSSSLVQLLLENDALQQESDARNVAIEQLLKMTVKITENELRPIQMSVVLPTDDCGDEV
ncbi:hypothetical protein X975_24049, partial [Stegodyphus mimosarum]